MSDIEHIRKRIAEIRSRLESDPKMVAKIEHDSQRDHAMIAQAESQMRSAKVVPLAQHRRKVRRPDDGTEVEL